MTEKQIIEHLWARNEAGIEALRLAYGTLALTVAQRIVGNPEDAEECVQDGLLAVWDSIPPQRPDSLKHYFLRLVRYKALDCRKAAQRDKRGGAELPLALEELDRDVPSSGSVEDEIAERLLSEQINVFLQRISQRERDLFLRRYYYFENYDQIAASMGMTKASVSVILFRTRKKLKDFLKKEELL